MFRKILIALLGLMPFVWTDEVHKFAGKHFVASYLNCDPKAISDVQGLLGAMDQAVASSGATILDQNHYVFEPNGLTAVYLLSESHGSIHTYPEFGACFVDLFTCGDHCSAEEFDAVLRAYLQPQTVNARYFIRAEGIEEIALSSSNAPPILLQN